MSGTILAFLTAVIAFCGFLLVDMTIRDKKRKQSLRQRLAADGSIIGQNADGFDEAPQSLNGEPSARAQSLLKMLNAIGINTEEAVHKLDLTFARAGINSPDGPIYYLFFQRIGALGLLMLALFIFASAKGSMMMYALALIVVVIAVFGPKLYMQNKIDNRKKVLQRSFPDTLDLLLICVESGLALDAALTRVCNELGRAYPEMTGELNRTRLELALINDRVKALTNLGERTDMTAFRSLISALIQSERFGTSLTDTLRVLSEDFRLERLSSAEAKAARLPVLMTIPLIFLLMPALFIVVLGPAIVGIMRI